MPGELIHPAEATVDQTSRRLGRFARGWSLGRALDHSLSPLLFALGATRKRRRRPPEGGVERVAMLQTGPIGDTVLSSSVVRDLRRRFPGAELSAVGTAENRAALELIPDVDAILAVDLFRPVDARRTLSQLRANLLVDVTPWPRISALLATTCSAGFSLGFRTPGQHRHYAFDHAVHHSHHLHELENLHALTRFLGVRDGAEPRLEVRGTGARRPGVVLHAWAAGSGKRRKEWPERHWIPVARTAHRHGYPVSLTGGPADRADAERLASLLGSEIAGLEIWNTAGDFPLERTASLLTEADAVVSVNTGIMHIAAILGTPLIALNGPTDPDRWGPVGPRCISLTPDDPDCGYLSLGFEYPASPPDCMAALAPERVVDHLVRLLDGRD